IASVGAVPAAAHAAEHHRAHEDAGQQAGAGIGVEVAAIVFGVGRAGLPVGASGASVTGDDLAHGRFGADGHAFGIGGAHGHGAQLPADRGPVDVFDRGAVLGVEEAGRTTHGQRSAVDAGAHALRGVATVFERLGDVVDIGGFVDLLERLLRDVVGVQRLLVVVDADRGPVEVFDRGAVLGVEEAGRTTHGQRSAVDAGAHALRGVATVFERLGDVVDIGGFVDLLERLLRDVVGVQSLLVVLGAS